MKILFVTLGFQPFRTSGFDVSGERLVGALLEDGHDVTVLAAGTEQIKETITGSKLVIHRLPLGRSDWIGYAYRSVQKIRTLGDFDVVHFWDVHFAYAYEGEFVASLHQSFRQRINVLRCSGQITARSSARMLYYQFARLLIEPYCVKKASGLMAVSRATQQEYTEGYGVEINKTILTRHGIDVEFFQPCEMDLHFRRQFGFRPSDPIILFTGFITPRKGIEYLAEAYQNIHPSPIILIAGKWHDETYRIRVKKLFEPFTGRLIELGFVPDLQLPELYSTADVYVSPSLMEGFGLPLAESLACGTPVVAFDAGATAEVVGPGGIIVPPKDVKALAEAISYLLQNPDIRQAMGVAGREHVQREFSVAAMLRSTLEAYDRFLGARS